MTNSSYEFQIIDIQADDIPTSDESYWDKELHITLYGKTIDRKNITCTITNYKPFFYLRLPSSWGRKKSNVNNLLSYINRITKSLGKKQFFYIQDELTISESYNFYGYNYDVNYNMVKKYCFAKITFKSYTDMKKCSAAIKDIYYLNLPYIKDGKIIDKTDRNKKPVLFKSAGFIEDWFKQEHNCECLANMYESKIHPLLRFIHEQDIKSSGWVRVVNLSSKEHVEAERKQFNVDIEITGIPYKNVRPCDKEVIAPFVTASFDIECDSSHGDFPNPVKDFKKLAIDIHESYFRGSVNNTSNTIQVKFLKDCLKDAFLDGSNDVQNIYTQNGSPSEESLNNVVDIINQKMITNDILKNSKESSKTRDKTINDLTNILNKNIYNSNGELIRIKGDPIIQIGTVFHRFGEKECYEKTMVIIGNEDKPDEDICDDIPGCTVYRCDNEKQLLLTWKSLILYHNPDILTGYNIFGFDFDYISKRVDHLFPCNSNCKKYKNYSSCDMMCCKNDFYRMGRLMRNRNSDVIESMDNVKKPDKTLKSYNNHWDKRCTITSKQLSSSGLGDNILKYITMDGRVVFDIQKEVQKGHSLESYKLDNVSAHFMKGTITNKVNWINHSKTLISTITIANLKENDYITIQLNTKYGSLNYNNKQKFKVLGINRKTKSFLIDGLIKIKKYSKELINYEWCLAKDDVSPQQIFDFHKHGGSSGRAKVAKYCIMDCELCIHLLLQLDLIPNNIGMASVSSVPLSYIFLRGQGIKITSLVTKVCNIKNTRIPTLVGFDPNKNDDGFEGAIVLEPTPGIYLDDPVSVLDFASLYPNSIRENNFSHETFICTQEEIDENPKKYDWLETIPYNKVSYDDYIYETKGKTVHKKKAETITTCYFAKEPEGIIPLILDTLLTERKNTRKKIKQTDDPFKKKVLDGLQLAYKVTANSVYGQMGAKTSSICFKKIAACTTSIGRQRIYDAKQGVIDWAKEFGYHPPETIYGDTDSVFVKFSRIHKDTGELLTGKEALKYCIDCGVKSGEWITQTKWKCKNSPQDLEYEKTFWPFILISKKRYTGDKYELDHTKPKERTSMGIVMKRRDNAPIVKYVFGNVVEIIMNQKDINLAMNWLQDILCKIKSGKIDESMFVITKSLSGYYKNPQGIAHKVLADRMAERNPGNKPKPNDRIPYMYIKVDESPIPNGFYKNGKQKFLKRKILQGDRIEHPEYIKQHKKDIDYRFYISNQIMNPVKQVLDLSVDETETDILFKPFI